MEPPELGQHATRNTGGEFGTRRQTRDAQCEKRNGAPCMRENEASSPAASQRAAIEQACDRPRRLKRKFQRRRRNVRQRVGVGRRHWVEKRDRAPAIELFKKEAGARCPPDKYPHNWSSAPHRPRAKSRTHARSRAVWPRRRATAVSQKSRTLSGNLLSFGRRNRCSPGPDGQSPARRR